MKFIIYDRFLILSSFVLNVCVRLRLWWIVKRLIDFRKKHIATELRYQIQK